MRPAISWPEVTGHPCRHGRKSLPQSAQAAPEEKPEVYPPDAFVHIRPDGRIVIQVNRLEFGQGVQTALPMVLADEMDADWSMLGIEPAPVDTAFAVRDGVATEVRSRLGNTTHIAVMDAEGVSDYASLKVNGGIDNVSVGAREVAVLGTVGIGG